MEHPEQGDAPTGFTQNPWDHLRYANFVRDLERARPEDLLELAKQLAYDHFVVAPAAKRFLIDQAMRRPGELAGDLVNEQCVEAPKG